MVYKFMLIQLQIKLVHVIKHLLLLLINVGTKALSVMMKDTQ